MSSLPACQIADPVPKLHVVSSHHLTTLFGYTLSLWRPLLYTFTAFPAFLPDVSTHVFLLSGISPHYTPFLGVTLYLSSSPDISDKRKRSLASRCLFFILAFCQFKVHPYHSTLFCNLRRRRLATSLYLAPAQPNSISFRLQMYHLTLCVLAASKRNISSDDSVCLPPRYLLVPFHFA